MKIIKYGAITIVVLFAIFITIGILADTKEVESEPVTTEKVEEKETVSQEELNKKLREEAKEVDFVELNTQDDSNVGEKVFATGEITNIEQEGKLGSFILGTEEGEGHGIYRIKNLDTTDEETLNVGDTIQIFGTVDGHNKDDGFIEITSTIIEPAEKE